MAKPFGEELKYYKDYMDLFYGSKSYLSPYEVSLFGDLEKQIERRRERLTDVSLESAARRGVLSSGITGKYITETVTEPIESAHAELGMQKIGMIGAEKGRRHKEALGMAIDRIQREREEAKRRGGFFGKLVGGAISGGITGFMAGGPMGALGGAGLGLVGAGFGGAGGGGEEGGELGYDNYLEMYLELLRKGKTPEEIEASFPRYGGGY